MSPHTGALDSNLIEDGRIKLYSVRRLSTQRKPTTGKMSPSPKLAGYKMIPLSGGHLVDTDETLAGQQFRFQT
jgi:hypothetical protein